MQNIEAGGMPARSGDRDEMYRAVVSELASLIDHIRKSRGPIESAIASDAAGEDAAASNVIVRDGVTPCHERVDAALPGLRRRLERRPSFAAGVHDAQRSRLRWPAADALRDFRPNDRSAARTDAAQVITASLADAPPWRLLAFLPLRKETSISVPLTRTSSQRR